MTHKLTIEIYIAMNEDGCFEAGCDAEEASTRLTDSFGGQMIRVIRKAFLIAPPAIMDIGEEDVADENGEVTKVETAAA